jgi:hypothetical protein
MVQRIESGRMQISQPGGVPMQQVQPRGVDYVGPRAEAQAASTLAQVLDRMSSSLFEQAGKMRQQEGLEFAATNPITPEQIDAAKRGDLSQLDVSKNPMSIFGQALNKARALELSSHFEIEGRNELAKLLVDIEAGNATSKQVQNKITTMTDGYGKSLAAINPEAAYKFRATMATHGNTVLASAYQAELKRAKGERTAKFDMDFDNGIRLLEATVAQQPDKIDLLADVFRQNVLDQSLLLGDVALQKEYSTKFEVALRNAKINAVTRELQDDVFMNNPIETLNRIRRGDIGRLSPVLQQLVTNDFDAVAKVTANFMVAVNQREQLAKDADLAIKREGEKQAINLLEQIFPLPEGDPKRKALVSQLTALPPGSVPIGTLKDLLDPGKEGNPMVEFNTLNGIYQGTVNTSDQIYNMPGLNGQQKIRLLKTLNSEDRRDQAEIARGLNKLAGINVTAGVVVLDPKGEEFRRLNELRARASEIQAAAMREGKVMMPSQVIDTLTKEVEDRRNTEAAKAARTALETVYEKRDWINGPITRESLPALEKKAGNDKNKLNDLKRIKSLLEQSEGSTNAAQ